MLLKQGIPYYEKIYFCEILISLFNKYNISTHYTIIEIKYVFPIL